MVPRKQGWCRVVRFVSVIRVPVCARVSRVCPGSPSLPRCLFTVELYPTYLASENYPKRYGEAVPLVTIV